VFENLELALKTNKGVKHSMFFRLDSAQSDRLAEILVTIHLADSVGRHRRQPEPWAEAVAGDRDAADAGPEVVVARRTGRRHDR
jgi:hypothetical protein